MLFRSKRLTLGTIIEPGGLTVLRPIDVYKRQSMDCTTMLKILGRYPWEPMLHSSIIMQSVIPAMLLGVSFTLTRISLSATEQLSSTTRPRLQEEPLN